MLFFLSSRPNQNLMNLWTFLSLPINWSRVLVAAIMLNKSFGKRVWGRNGISAVLQWWMEAAPKLTQASSFCFQCSSRKHAPKLSCISSSLNNVDWPLPLNVLEKLISTSSDFLKHKDSKNNNIVPLWSTFSCPRSGSC